MQNRLNAYLGVVNFFRLNSFLFSRKYHVRRHVAFWLINVLFFSTIWTFQGERSGFGQNAFTASLWIPMRMLFCYPLIYWALPKYLLKEKYLQFGVLVSGGLIAGLFLSYLFRAYVFIPLQEFLQVENFSRNAWSSGGYLSCVITAVTGGIVVLFKHWMKKQQAWMQAEKEKVTAELQLLKAQVHPHFLFNTLNNIYSFSLDSSPKTPEMILKLSSLLSYMLYECKGDEVLLEKEIEVMKAYKDLEKERYGNRLDISWNVEGDIKDKFIAPLLLLPFLENAFKHGTSELLEKPWLSVDIIVKGYSLRCKIANSKDEFMCVRENGIGIQNVRKRLQFLYPDNHELKLADESNFFVASLLIELMNCRLGRKPVPMPTTVIIEKIAT
jgi:two-component system sensor histidine kinase AlgZ